MDLINNVTKTLRDDLSAEIKDGSKLSIAAACFSIYAFQELKAQLKDIDELLSKGVYRKALCVLRCSIGGMLCRCGNNVYDRRQLNSNQGYRR